jgi:hypothetical protein
MSFRILFHNDFDGMASAGIFANFIDSTKIETADLTFHAVDYNTINDYYATDFVNSSCVLDFPFNSSVKWWFDHHKTSFKDESYQKSYEPSPYRYWNTRAKSCPALLFTFFKKYYPQYDSKMSQSYSKLVHYSSIIDSAKYKNPKQVYDFSDPYITFNHILNHQYSAEMIHRFVIAVRSTNLERFFESKVFSNARTKVIDVFDKYDQFFKSNLKTNKNIIELNFIDAGLRGDRYLGYLYNPNADYTITIDKRDSHYYLGIGYNPWKKDNCINIGTLLKKYGGGGRMNVGAALFNNAGDLEFALNKIRSKLRD